MSQAGRSRTGAVVELCFNGFLLLCFTLQAFLLACFFVYGHLPLPENWVSEAITSRLPDGLSIRAESYSIHPDGTLRVESGQLYLDRFQEAVFKVGKADLTFGLQWDKAAPFYLKECLLSNGLLSLPAVYSPDGNSSAILDRIAVRLLPTEKGVSLESIAARHGDVSLRGSIDWAGLEATREPINTQAKTDLFFKQVAKILLHKQRLDGLAQPTVFFQIEAAPDKAFDIQTRITSPQYAGPGMQAKNLTLDARLSLIGQKVVGESAIGMKADSIELPPHDARASFITAKIEPEEWGALLNEKIPDMEVMAERLDIKDVHLETPRIKLTPRAFPEISFTGLTSGHQGAVQFSGSVNTETNQARIEAAGSLDLQSIVPKSIAGNLPEWTSKQSPYYNLSLQFEEGFALNRAELRARINRLEVAGIDFEQVRFKGGYHQGVYKIERLDAQRDGQWLNLGFKLNRSSKDYALTLKGFVKPADYNPILPDWWEAIFRDFSFEKVESGLGDFVVYGNTGKKAADFLFGHVWIRGASYKGVRVDESEFFVRGKGPYIEIDQLNAQSGEGYVRGDLRFTSRSDAIRGPVSVRLDLETKLPLADAKKLFDKNIAGILSDFETEALPHTLLRGAIFNKAYPEFHGLSHIDLSVACPFPVNYKGLPLDRLNFNLLGRKGITYLRGIEFGYAGGIAHATADIITVADGPARARFQLFLKGAEQGRAIKQLTAIQKEKKQVTQTTPPGEGRLDLRLHALAPTQDPLRINGSGNLKIKNDTLHSIQLFGPLSKLLQNIRLGFTSFSLSEMETDFTLKDKTVHFKPLEINGPRTRIKAFGTMGLEDFSLAMRVSVYLFGNLGAPDSRVRKLSEFVTRPLPNILEFELSGTPENQNWRSLYDPRQFIPQF